MSDTAGHCDACPVDEGRWCPAGHWCAKAAAERLRADPRQHHWLEAIRRKAGAGPPPAGPGLPGGFPSREDARGRARVGLLCPCLNLGGAEAHQVALARHCDPERIAWMGCAVLGGDGAADPGMRALTSALMPVAGGRAAAVALARGCDVLVTWAIDGLPAILAESGTKAKVVAVVHAPPESPWGRTVYARPEGIDRWVAVSELALAALPRASTGRVPASVIGNCVDPARLEVRRTRAEMRERWGIPTNARVAGFLGRLAHEKDPHAMARLVRRLPADWHAVLVGAGDERVEPHPRLHPAGPDPAAGDCLAAFDVLIVPSFYESFGLTLAEGLWMGTPVVSTEVGLAKLHPGLTHHVPVGADGETLARAVRRALAFGPMPYSREWARENLGPERFGQEWTDLICELAPGRPASRAEVLARVRECPDRGGVLPLSMQREGCSKCGELSECRSGKGATPGRVSLRDCIECVS